MLYQRFVLSVILSFSVWSVSRGLNVRIEALWQKGCSTFKSWWVFSCCTKPILLCFHSRPLSRSVTTFAPLFPSVIFSWSLSFILWGLCCLALLAPLFDCFHPASSSSHFFYFSPLLQWLCAALTFPFCFSFASIQSSPTFLCSQSIEPLQSLHILLTLSVCDTLVL